MILRWLVFFLGMTSIQSQETPSSIAYTGFLIDIFCWNLPGHVALDGSILDTNPEVLLFTFSRKPSFNPPDGLIDLLVLLVFQAHHAYCMLLEVCKAGGFGFLGNKEEGGYYLKYVLDEEGNRLAIEILEGVDGNSDNLIFTAEGDIDESDPAAPLLRPSKLYLGEKVPDLSSDSPTDTPTVAPTAAWETSYLNSIPFSYSFVFSN